MALKPTSRRYAALRQTSSMLFLHMHKGVIQMGHNRSLTSHSRPENT